jgi:16S rRNA (uracil1498-N3)-methyltransferase
LHSAAALHAGPVELDRDEAHHARDVLRLGVGDAVELFDDAGAVGRAVIERCDAGAVVVRVDRVEPRPAAGALTIASAVPKGDRAEWMVEKLSELGVDRFVPLAAARSVVLPAGKNKRDRWQRIATEAAKQSRRAGVMRIEVLTEVVSLLTPSPGSPEVTAQRLVRGWGEGSVCYLDTDPRAQSLIDHLQSQISDLRSQITLLIGPEGGWTDEETAVMRDRGLTGVKLTATILRVETAAVAAAAIVATWLARGGPSRERRASDDAGAP